MLSLFVAETFPKHLIRSFFFAALFFWGVDTTGSGCKQCGIRKFRFGSFFPQKIMTYPPWNEHFRRRSMVGVDDLFPWGPISAHFQGLTCCYFHGVYIRNQELSLKLIPFTRVFFVTQLSDLLGVLRTGQEDTKWYNHKQILGCHHWVILSVKNR